MPLNQVASEATWIVQDDEEEKMVIDANQADEDECEDCLTPPAGVSAADRNEATKMMAPKSMPSTQPERSWRPRRMVRSSTRKQVYGMKRLSAPRTLIASVAVARWH